MHQILINSCTIPSFVWMWCQLIKDTTKVPVFSHNNTSDTPPVSWEALMSLPGLTIDISQIICLTDGMLAKYPLARSDFLVVECLWMEHYFHSWRFGQIYEHTFVIININKKWRHGLLLLHASMRNNGSTETQREQHLSAHIGRRQTALMIYEINNGCSNFLRDQLL